MSKPLTSPDIEVLRLPHPFRAERIRARIPAGGSIADIISGTGSGDGPWLHAYIDGHWVARADWARIRPKAGTIVTLRAVPMGGGGGKNPLRTILSLALMAASPGIAAGILGALGGTAGTILARAVTAGVSLAGRLAINALAPPARPRFSAQKESPTLFIQGAQNRATPFGRVPRVLGRHRFVPPYGAYPYTETAGGEQYLRLLFVWGYGPLHITDLKIGETALSEFEGVEVETRQGYDDDAPLTLYSNSVLQNDLGVSLTAEDGFILRTTEAEADEIGVDITLPRGLVRFSGSGGRRAASVRIEIQYSPAGMNDWSAGMSEYKDFSARSIAAGSAPQAYRKQGVTYAVLRADRLVMDGASGDLAVLKGEEWRSGIDDGAPVPADVPAGKILLARIDRRSDETGIAVEDARADFLFHTNFRDLGDFLPAASLTAGMIDIAAGGLQFPGIEITGKQTAALRETVTFKVPKGQYDVRLRRITQDAGDNDKVFDETVWSALRTVRYAYPVRMPGIAMTAMRIKATGQLNGVIDRFNGVVTSILPDWTGEEWVPQPTSNPASLFRHVLQGAANARPLPDSRIDIEKLQAWHGRCDDAARRFNMVIDYDISVREVLNAVAATGRAAPALVDGKWGVVEDILQSVPVQHFTPRNSFNFEGRKSFDELPEALRLRFINAEKGWLQDERLVFEDGYDEENATRYETLELPGVTDAAQAWRDGRYHIASARLRPETYSFSCDIEHIVCTRGDLIRFSHDVPLFGLSTARVKSLQTADDMATGVTLDAEVTMESGKNYAVRFRAADGTSRIAALTAAAGSFKTVQFSTPVAVSVAPQKGDLALFGEAGTESVELIVKSITPQSNLTARLTCVDAAPAVHAAESGTLPPFSSQMTVPPEMQRPPQPVLAAIQSGEEALIRNTDGSLSTRILITLQPPVFGGALSAQVMLRAQDETRFRQAEVTAQGSHRLSVGDVEEGESYDLQIRYVNAGGIFSAPLAIAGHRVEGTAALPSNVAALNARVLGEVAHLNWPKVADLDLDHYVLRFSPQAEGAAWSGAVDLIASLPRDASSAAVPAAAGTYLLKAVDVGGRMSVLPATAVLGAGVTQNAVLSLEESPYFMGTRSHVARSAGALQLAGQDDFDTQADVDAIENFDYGPDGLWDSGIYEFAETADLGAVYTSRLTARLAVSAFGYGVYTDGWDNIDLIENFDDGLDQSQWGITLQLRMTDDDPGASPAWTDWQEFAVGDYRARAFQFRLLLSGASHITPLVTQLSVMIDMPDRLLGDNDIAAAAAGQDIAFDPPFRAVPAIAVTPHDLAAGDYYTMTLQAKTGFRIRFFDSAGNGVARRFDYLARGYGEQH